MTREERDLLIQEILEHCMTNYDSAKVSPEANQLYSVLNGRTSDIIHIIKGFYEKHKEGEK